MEDCRVEDSERVATIEALYTGYGKGLERSRDFHQTKEKDPCHTYKTHYGLIVIFLFVNVVLQ